MASLASLRASNSARTPEDRPHQQIYQGRYITSDILWQIMRQIHYGRYIMKWYYRITLWKGTREPLGRPREPGDPPGTPLGSPGDAPGTPGGRPGTPTDHKNGHISIILASTPNKSLATIRRNSKHPQEQGSHGQVTQDRWLRDCAERNSLGSIRILGNWESGEAL